MKKRLLLVISLMMGSMATANADNIKTTVGAGIGISESPYKGVDKQSVKIPSVNINWGDFYAKTGDIDYSLLSLGYNFYKGDALVLSTYVNPYGGFNVDRSEMEDGYNNIDKRRYQVEGGLKALYRPGWNGLIAQGHLTVGEKGGHTGLALMRPIRLSEKMLLVPKISATYFESNYVDYYFGVDKGEVQKNDKIDDTYDPNGAFSYSANIALQYKLTKDMKLVGFVGIEKLSGEIEDSPIVDDTTLIKSGMTLTYTF